MEQSKIQELAIELWCDFADESDGFETTMNYDSFIKAMHKALTTPVVMQSCDTCKHLSNCRFWQEAPNNGATCKFYIEYVRKQTDKEQ